MPDSKVLPRRHPQLHHASFAVLLALLGCQTIGAARTSGANATRRGGAPLGESAGLDGGSSLAPAPPGTTASSAPAAKSLRLLPHLHVCLSARADLARAHVSLTVLRGSPETRLVLQTMLKQKAVALGVDVSDDRCDSQALICAWTNSARAAELATSWARSLMDPTAGELYAIRGEVLRSADEWDETSFWWRVHTTSSALGRLAPSSADPLLLSKTSGANYLRSAPVAQLEASLRRALIGAELSVFDPAPPDLLASSLRGLVAQAQEASPPVSPPGTDPQPSNTPSLVTLREKNTPLPAVAVFAWGSDDESTVSFEMKLGLEVLRTRFNQAHAKDTEVRARWTPQMPFSAPPRLALLGPAAGMPSAIDLLREELLRLTSTTGMPTQTELDRALLRVRSQEQDSAPRSLCRKYQPGGPGEVTRALRVLPAPHVVLAAGEETPPTEAE